MSNAVWANWDISPTVCALTQTAPPRNIDGLDMSRVLMRGAPAPANRSLFWQFDEGELRQVLLQDNWKLVRLKKKGEPERLELYDLRQDEGETTNLAASKPDKVAALLTLLKGAQTPAEHPQFDWSKSEL
ncbi:alkaline phosphatase family protein [Rudanella paleaurantiibacter]|uniref:hypothetical protein n=1 Tax=Rudanella paleaurantiibacter TaxID=2614655 RepID=UPI001FE8E98F|nr:hypothetical protein [Rudanella paleaurantiibacter]